LYAAFYDWTDSRLKPNIYFLEEFSTINNALGLLLSDGWVLILTYEWVVRALVV